MAHHQRTPPGDGRPKAGQDRPAPHRPPRGGLQRETDGSCRAAGCLRLYRKTHACQKGRARSTQPGCGSFPVFRSFSHGTFLPRFWFTVCGHTRKKTPRAAPDRGSPDAAPAIMTTDTHKKEYAIQFELGGKMCTVGAIGKGSGMIAPNMATMLAFYTTDAAVSPVLLEKALKTVVPGTYNQMSVDLDTSTNDTLIIMASGLAGNPEICEENADYHAFVAALTAIAEHMCAEHAGDGEGATHLITCEVTHAPDLKTARAVSRSVVCSNLFKAAVFGRDANWGRILCAIGYTPGDFSIDKVCVRLSSKAGEVYVCENAAYHPYSEEEAAKVLAEHDILVKVDMGTGDASAKAWGCDLTYDYVKINGDYRT